MASQNTTTMSEFPEPVAIQRNIPEIFQIFHNVQFNTVQHKKYVKELKRVYQKIDQDAFCESFTNALHYLFTFGEANGNVDRVMQFIANFCGALNEGEEEFLHYIFGIIFDCVAVAGQGVRSRACQLIGLILSGLGDDASLDDDLCDKILNTLLERLQDVRGAVRSRAVLALQRLQNPADTEDPVTRAYAFHMSCDPSAAVRRGVVLGLAKSPRNLLHVLERLCDVDESVRKAAFLYVSSINVTQLKVRQRIHILKVGLTERSLRVRRVVETALLPGWLGAYHGDVLQLLASVRLDNLQGAKDSATVAGNLLQALFKHQQISELLEWLPVEKGIRLIPAERLNKESAWYWRHLVRHLHSIQDTDNLELLLPELVIFTGYVRALVESPCPNAVEQPVEFSKRQYVLQELISIFPVYDMADEVGRNALQTFLYDTLTGNYGPLDADVIQAAMRAIELVVTDVTKRIEFVAGIISEIHEPAEEVQQPLPLTPMESTQTKIMRAELRVALNEAQEDQEDAVRARNFVLAAECKERVDELAKKLADINTNLIEVTKPVQPVIEVVREKHNDTETLNKCLIILNMMLDTPDITTLTPVLKSLFQNFEVMLYQNMEIRENALQTVALYSMLSEEFAKEQKAFFFSQFMDMDNEKLLVVALKSVIDVICIHGVKIFNIESDSEKKEKKKNKKKESDSKKANKTGNKSSRKSKADKSTGKKSKMDDIWGSDSGESSEEEEEEAESSDKETSDNEDASAIPSTHDTIIELFLGLMNSECSEYRLVVVEGLCRMLIAGRLCSSSLISRLLLLWFNPATEDEDGLKQILGTFFPLFAANTEGGQEQLEAAFLPTVITLAGAPLSSPLADVDQETVLRFIIGLTVPSVAPSAHNVHANLAVLIVNVLERGEETAAPLLCRALALLTPPRVPALCRDLLRSADELMQIFTDKTSYRNISRFSATVSLALDSLEQRASAAAGALDQEQRVTSEPALETVPEGSEPRSSIISNTLSEKESDAVESAGSEDVSMSSKSPSEGSEVEMEPSSKSSIPSKHVEVYDSPAAAKIKRITAADVAKRALLKTPRRKRDHLDLPQPAATPSRAVEPPTPSSAVRRSARANKGESRRNLSPPTTGKKREVKSKEEQPKGRAVKGLGKQLEQVSLKESIPPKAKSKPKQKAFELFETKKGGTAAKKARGKKAAPEPEPESSDSSDAVIEESSDDDETVLHTICHYEPEDPSLLNDSSSEDEEVEKPPKKSRMRAANVTVPETSESSEEESESSEEEEVIPTSQNWIRRKK